MWLCREGKKKKSTDCCCLGGYWWLLTDWLTAVLILFTDTAVRLSVPEEVMSYFDMKRVQIIFLFSSLSFNRWQLIEDCDPNRLSVSFYGYSQVVLQSMKKFIHTYQEANILSEANRVKFEIKTHHKDGTLYVFFSFWIQTVSSSLVLLLQNGPFCLGPVSAPTGRDARRLTQVSRRFCSDRLDYLLDARLKCCHNRTRPGSHAAC